MTPNTLPLIDNDDIHASESPADRPGCGELRLSSGDRLPLKALLVDAHIVGLTATSTVRQRFVNDGATAIEATYIFPLPARAGVTDFTATLGAHKVVATLKERGQARLEYEEALEAGQRAAIMEEDRRDVFTVRVGNLGPGEEALIELVFTGPLEVQDGEATFRLPLVAAPRYTTGSPLSGDQTGAGTSPDTGAVPDASRVTPPRLEPGDVRPELAVTVTVEAVGLPVSDFRSSLQSTVVEGTTAGTTVVRLLPGVRADRDFLLRFGLDRSALATSAVVVRDDGGMEEGTWSVTVIPPAEAIREPRDVVVVLDRSGSMEGWKMVAARRAAGRIVDSLDMGDRFCVLGFDDRIEHPAGCSALVDASDRNRFAASSWLGSLEARGGTEMARALLEAADVLSRSGGGRRAVLVLVTDGQISGEDHLLRSLEPRLGATTIHCVGVDRAVNAGFLDRLARRGKGHFHLVESEDRLDAVMASLARTIGRPVLEAVSVTGHGIDIVAASVTPVLPPDAFAGVPCVVSGRYRGALPEETTLTVTASGAGGAQSFTLVPHRSDAAAVRTIWARAALGDLEDAYYAHRAPDVGPLIHRIVEHSIRFGVLSRFTAYVAVDPERTEVDALDEVVQPVEAPSGWDRIGGVPRSAARAAMPLAAYIGDSVLGLELGDVGAVTSGSPDLDLPIEDLDLSERPRACLKRAGVHTVGELVQQTEDDLRAITDFGQPLLDEVLEKLDERGLSLRSIGATPSRSTPRDTKGPARPAEAGRRTLGSVSNRSLGEVLGDLETLLQLEWTDTDDVMRVLRDELEAACDTTEDRGLQIALVRLCEALETYLSSHRAPTSRDPQPITEAIELVRAAMVGHPERLSQSERRFWH